MSAEQQSPICFRALPRFKAAIEEAAKIRGWTRTTWILYWLGKGLDHDRDLFGLTDDDRQRRERRLAQMREYKRTHKAKT